MKTFAQVASQYHPGQAPTSSQISFIKRLSEERAVPAGILEYNRKLWRLGSFNARAASLLIDSLGQYPVIGDKVKKNNEELLGMHIIGTTVIRVKRGQTGNLYAQTLNQALDGTWHFEYSPKLISKLSKETRMNIEQAQYFGKHFSHCACCGRKLSDPKSIAAGIGPDCAKKF